MVYSIVLVKRLIKNKNHFVNYNLLNELEIDKEDVHDRKKWRRNVMKRKSNPIGKRTINR